MEGFELDPNSVNNVWQNVLATGGLNILISIVIFIIGRWLAQWASRAADQAMIRAKVDETLRNFALSILYYLLLFIVIVIALNNLGFSTASIVAVLGAAGIAVGLALKDSLSNFAAGTMIIFFQLYKVGDFVEVNGATGAVREVRIFNTLLETPDRKLVLVPNGQVLSDNITNYTESPTRRLDMVFGISYDDDLRHAKRVLQEIVAAEERCMKEPAPLIAVIELGDSSVNFGVRPFVKNEEYWDVMFAITEQVKLRFDEEGISMPYPQRDVHLFTAVSEQDA
ncbi:MAG: mechanosensitive ion channel [Anaerolineales bacterium]|nr:mechanosensitive ion channel [Anaerolineales bacterium]